MTSGSTLTARGSYELPASDMRYTRHQVLRGTLPDAEDSKYIYLIKAPSELRKVTKNGGVAATPTQRSPLWSRSRL